MLAINILEKQAACFCLFIVSLNEIWVYITAYAER